MTTPPQFKSELDRLNAGLLMRCFELATKEPEQAAIDGVSDRLRHAQRQQQYCTEVLRIHSEMKLTIGLAKEVPKRMPIAELEHQREDVLLYFQGVFLDLLHQLKDKLLRLLFLATSVAPAKPPRKVSHSKLLSARKTQLAELGIVPAIEVWSEDSKSSIRRALDERTLYHHHINPLHYGEHVSLVKAARTLNMPMIAQHLSDDGKAEIKSKGEEAMAALENEALARLQAAESEARTSLDFVAPALVTYLNLPITDQAMGQVMADYQAMNATLRVVNATSLEKLPDPFREQLTTMLERDCSSEVFAAIYLTGDIARGEAVPRLSGCRVFAVTREEPSFDSSFNQMLMHWQSRGCYCTILRLDDFKKPEHRKDRFVCWADGIRLWGEDLIGDEQFPKAGLCLSWLLCEQAKRELDEVDAWIEGHADASAEEIVLMTQNLARQILEFRFALVMSNDPGFTASTSDRIVRILKMYPQLQPTMDLLVEIIKFGREDIESLRNMLIGFRLEMAASYETMRSTIEALPSRNSSIQ